MRAPSTGFEGALRAFCVALALLTIGGCGPGGEPPESRPPDAEGGRQPVPSGQPSRPEIVLLVSIDTLRADHLGAYGHHRFTSPIIDAVAAEGTLFEDASTTAPWTLPSHASLLTGLYPNRHGVLTIKGSLPEEVPTLAGMLRKAGFRTATVVNNTWLSRELYGLTRDFDDYRLIYTPEDHRGPNRWITDEALLRLEERKAGRLFLFVHYYDVHTDYASTDDYERLFVTPYDGPFTGETWQLQVANLEDDYIAFCTREFDPEKCRFGSHEGPRHVDESVVKVQPDADDLRHLEELYDAGIRQLDTELGRLIGFLRESGLEDRTLLIITSDHGEEFGDHGRVDHFLTQYQEVLHVPLIFRGPGVPAGKRISTPVSLVDVVPTVLSMSGVKPPPKLDGLDLSPLLEGGGEEPFADRFQFGEGAGGLTYDAIVAPGIFPVYRSVRRGHHKLIYESKTDRYALYDLATDPGEETDISADEPELTAELIEVMRARYANFTPVPRPENQVELSPEDLERLRALGYVP